MWILALVGTRGLPWGSGIWWAWDGGWGVCVCVCVYVPTQSQWIRFLIFTSTRRGTRRILSKLLNNEHYRSIWGSTVLSLPALKMCDIRELSRSWFSQRGGCVKKSPSAHPNQPGEQHSFAKQQPGVMGQEWSLKGSRETELEPCLSEAEKVRLWTAYLTSLMK